MTETKELKIEIPKGYEIDKENSTFEKIVFKKKSNKPKSWKEYYEQQRNETHFVLGYDVVGGYSSRRGIYESGYYTVPSKELAEAFLAMMQIISLRHDWIHKWSIDKGMTYDWKPDWISNSTYTWCIISKKHKLEVNFFYTTSRALSFPSEEMARNFMNHFRSLLEIAKPLI